MTGENKATSTFELEEQLNGFIYRMMRQFNDT